ncbi:succinate receptor 1 isoform X2 [Pithys albifrons albifrons]|uniref:succinate receptor 1 isoform X2 n=1 Tax=Pithys albifrons albifrons TaxID=3385563 RepID=UPI003A5CC245
MGSAALSSSRLRPPRGFPTGVWEGEAFLRLSSAHVRSLHPPTTSAPCAAQPHRSRLRLDSLLPTECGANPACGGGNSPRTPRSAGTGRQHPQPGHDLLFLCNLPVLVNSYSHDQWAKDGILCHSSRFLLHANLYSSILFLTAISVDRYMLIKHPFRDHVLQKRRTAVLVSIAIWIGVILELLPLMHFLEPLTPANNYKCLDYASSGDATKSLIYSMFLTVFGFFIPLLIMCCFYVKMVCFLKNRSEHLSSPLTLEKPLTLVILTVVIFSLLFTPYHVMRNVRLASRIPTLNVSECTQGIISTIYVITRPFAFLNSAINPVFYFLMGDHFRDMLMAKTRQLLGRLTTTRK